MTVLSRGARVRRGGRRPGWLLLTTLLVLAIGASSALVFTDRVELLKLAVILALWAAVVAAFVSVIYRRQSDVDQARVRDLKLVYDLQLDREISARREYELTVESQLRRELASELRAQAADEVAALRTELAALRTNLEILFETELEQRPALETERATVRGYSEWSGSVDGAPADWVSSNRVTSVRAETTPARPEESSIIDVPEEPVPRQPVVNAAEVVRGQEAYRPPDEVYSVREAHRGTHWRPSDDDGPVQERPDNRRHARRQQETPAPADPRSDYRDARSRSQPRPDPPPEPQRPDWYPPPAAETPRPGGAATEWQPTASDGRWAPAAVPNDNWTVPDDDSPNTDPGVNGFAPVREPSPPQAQPLEPTPPPQVQPLEPAPPPQAQPLEPTGPPAPQRGRHSGPDDAEAQTAGPDSGAQQRVSARHSTEHSGYPAGEDTSVVTHANGVQPPTPASPPPTVAEPVARHRSTELVEEEDGTPTGGQSVADLLARFQVEPAGGGRRRRREE